MRIDLVRERHGFDGRGLGVTSRRGLLILVLGSVVVSGGCTTHRVTAVHPCPALVTQQTVVAVPNRGAIGMDKIGLTPDGLKSQQKCS
jgi:hypothetical protein